MAKPPIVPEIQSNYGDGADPGGPLLIPSSTWVYAVLVTCFCFMPAGVVALVFLGMATGAAQRDPEKARNYLRYAHTATSWAMIISVSLIIGLLLLPAILAEVF